VLSLFAAAAILLGSQDESLEVVWELEAAGSGSVRTLALSHDRKWLASGGSDKKVRIWDLSTGKLVQEASGHTADVSTVTWSADGKHVVSGSWREDLVRRWEASSGKQLKSMPVKDAWTLGDGTPNLPAPARVRAAHFSPDGKLLALALDEHIALCNPQTLAELGRLPGHRPPKQDPTEPGIGGSYDIGVYAVAFSADSGKIVSGGTDRVARIWDVKTRKELHALKGHSKTVGAACFSPDGKRTATGSYDGTVRTWDVKSGKELRSWSLGGGGVMSVSFGSGGKWLVAGSEGGDAKIWDSESGEEVVGVSKGLRGVEFSFSSDGALLAGGGSSGTLTVWRMPGVASQDNK